MGRPRDMEGIRSRGIVLFAVGVCLLLATVVVLERDVDEQPVASYTTDMAPHAALTAAATKRAAFKASIKAAFLRAVGKTPPATALHHRQSLFPDSFRVLKLQARQSKYRERNARFHNDKGYGRRLLGAGKKKRKNKDDDEDDEDDEDDRDDEDNFGDGKANVQGGRNAEGRDGATPSQAKKAAGAKNGKGATPSQAKKAAGAKNGKATKMGDVLQEFGGSTTCKASGGNHKDIVMKKDHWAYLGAYGRTGYFVPLFIKLAPGSECYSNLIAKIRSRHWWRHRKKLRAQSETYKDGKKTCILLWTRAIQAKKCSGRAAIKKFKAKKNKVISDTTWKDTREGGWILPRIIGSEGDCFAKCKTVLWLIKEAQGNGMTECTRNLPLALGCKTPSGTQGFIDMKTGAWMECFPSRTRRHAWVFRPWKKK